MKGLRIIPMFLMLIVCTYVGMLFVEANPQEVSISIFKRDIQPIKLGFVILTSVLLGMLVSGLLCSIQISLLTVQNGRLRKKLKHVQKKEDSGVHTIAQPVEPA